MFEDDANNFGGARLGDGFRPVIWVCWNQIVGGGAFGNVPPHHGVLAVNLSDHKTSGRWRLVPGNQDRVPDYHSADTSNNRQHASVHDH